MISTQSFLQKWIQQSICIVLLIIFVNCVFAHTQSEEVSQEKIKALISKTFDQPNQKVKTNPIVVEGKVAIADWIQGQKGGRALLRRKHDEWEIIACGGAGFKDPNGIAAVGISKEIAKNITVKLSAAESKLSTQQVKQFDSFDGVVNMVHEAKHAPNIKH
jgi:hypothetical protein